jgi:hypothetical protein
MAATTVHTPLRSLDPTVEAIFNAALAPIGARAVGYRGNILELEIDNRTIAAGVNVPFDEAIRSALSQGAAAEHWRQFRSAIYR